MNDDGRERKEQENVFEGFQTSKSRSPALADWERFATGIPHASATHKAIRYCLNIDMAQESKVGSNQMLRCKIL